MRKGFVMRVVAFAVALLCCSGCLFACSGKRGDKDTDTDENNNPTAQSGWSIGSGQASFRIVHPQNPPQAVRQALEGLLAAFEEQTGVRPEVGDDYLQRGKIYDASTYEILLGRTKHDQTQTVLGGLERGQYAVRVIGKKIVITAPDDADLAAAVDHFVQNTVNSMAGQDGVYTLSASDFTSELTTADSTVTINGNSIADYRIVYESERPGYMAVANFLRSTMKDLGYSVSIVSDRIAAETDGAKEILIGKTNRQVSQKLYGEKEPALMTYQLVVSGTYLQLMSGGPFSAKACVGDMLIKFFNATDKAFADGVYLQTDIRPEQNAVTARTDVRMMTVNVLAERWTSVYADAGVCPPIEQRAEIFAAMLIGSTPDVVGIQEADKSWIKNINDYLPYLKEHYGIEYTWLFSDWCNPAQVAAGVAEGQTLTSILYRSDRYRAGDSGIQNADWWTSTEYNIRLFDWVYLEEKDNSRHAFLFTNTHWAQLDGSTPQERVDASVQMSIDCVNMLKSRYPGVPIFSAGDYNSSERAGSDYTDRFLAETGCFDAMLRAVENGVRVNDCDGCAYLSSTRAENTGHYYIDHIACHGSAVDVLKYETLTGYNIYFSDHLPHLMDMKLW